LVQGEGGEEGSEKEIQEGQVSAVVSGEVPVRSVPRSLFPVVALCATASCGATGEHASSGVDAATNEASLGDANASPGDVYTSGDERPASNNDAQSMQCAVLNNTPSGNPPPLTTGRWINISPPGLYRPDGSVPSYGCMDIHVLPCDPYTLYLTTDIEGMWKSTDGGATWRSIGNLSAPVSPGVMQIDPKNPLSMYYGGGVRGASLGFWVSADGGNTWTQPPAFVAQANNSMGGWSNDVYVVQADPADFQHVLVTFHSPWEFGTAAGVLESKDGGNTWVRHGPLTALSLADGGTTALGAGHSIFFLGNASTWLLGTQGHGFWRTTDSGTTWTQVSTVDMQHGGARPFYAKTGVLYVPALSTILRSTDNALSFASVGPQTPDGFYDVIGDDRRLYAQSGNTGGNSTGPKPYLTSPEGDGITWTPLNDQTFDDGPYRMAFDSVNGVVYSANWNSGVWALKVN
jgi:hypothetical protein